jgi:hypothetical protein
VIIIAHQTHNVHGFAGCIGQGWLAGQLAHCGGGGQDGGGAGGYAVGAEEMDFLKYYVYGQNSVNVL